MCSGFLSCTAWHITAPGTSHDYTHNHLLLSTHIQALSDLHHAPIAPYTIHPYTVLILNPTSQHNIAWRSMLLTPLRICNQALLRRGLGHRCSPRFTSLRPVPSTSVAAHETNLHPAPSTRSSRCLALTRQRHSIVSKSSMTTQEPVAMSPPTQDHSSFANYRQAAVTHIDFGKRKA